MSGCQKRSPLCSPSPRARRPPRGIVQETSLCGRARASARLASPRRAAAVNRIAPRSSIVYEHRCRRRKCNGTRFPRLSRLLILRDTCFSVAGTPATRAASASSSASPREITRETGSERERERERERGGRDGGRRAWRRGYYFLLHCFLQWGESGESRR